MRLHLTTRQDLATPLFRLRVLAAILVVLAAYVTSALFPHFDLFTVFLLGLLFLPKGNYPMDLLGAAIGPMFVAVCAGPEFSKYSLAFNLGFAVVSSAILGTMGFFISRWSVRDLTRHEPKTAA